MIIARGARREILPRLLHFIHRAALTPYHLAATLSGMGEKTKKRKGSIGEAILSLTLLGAAMYGCVWAVTPSDETIARREAERRAEIEADPLSGARYACREFVNRSLIAPSTADYGRWSAWPAGLNDDGSVLVVAEFDAQNSYGAMIRQRMGCEIVREDGQWFLQRLIQS